jgi:hypothetical protein
MMVLTGQAFRTAFLLLPNTLFHQWQPQYMFHHQAEFVGQIFQAGQIGRVVEAACSGPHLVQMRGQVAFQADVLGMAALDIGAQFPEAVANHRPVVEKSPWAADDVHRIEVDSKSRPVNGLDQIQVCIGAVRKHPRHQLQRIKGPLRPDCVDNPANDCNDPVKYLVVEIFF